MAESFLLTSTVPEANAGHVEEVMSIPGWLWLQVSLRTRGVALRSEGWGF